MCMLITQEMLSNKRYYIGEKVGNCVWHRERITVERLYQSGYIELEMFLGVTSDQLDLRKERKVHNILLKPAQMYDDDTFQEMFDLSWKSSNHLYNIALKLIVRYPSTKASTLNMGAA